MSIHLALENKGRFL